MSKVLERQSGFTLIETILVMAIGSMLAVIALNGFSALRGQAQFSDSIERMKEKTLSLRQEALSTVKTSGTGADGCRVTLGKVLTFTVGSSDVQVQTISGDNTDPAVALGCLPQPIAVIDATTTSVPWGVTYTGSTTGGTLPVVAVKRQVAFVRSTANGSNGALVTAVSPAGGWGPTYTAANLAPGGTALDLNFSDPTGRRAYLTVNPANNGVTRTFR